MTARCARCRQKINHNESTYVVMLDKLAGKLTYHIERTIKVPDGNVVLHMNGDRECGKEVSGFRSNILKIMGLSLECDTEFLDYL